MERPYERAAIEEWFQLNSTSPMTNLPLESTAFHFQFRTSYFNYLDHDHIVQMDLLPPIKGLASGLPMQPLKRSDLLVTLLQQNGFDVHLVKINCST